jgi:hypothetical protein
MPKPEPEIGNMTNPLLSGEETAKLVERLQTRASNWERIGADDHAALDRQAAALLTTQASEIERLRGERDAAREAFLNMIADAKRWDEDVDGDTDGEGGMVITCQYHLTTAHGQLEELVDALGIKRAFDEGAGEAIDRALREPVKL